MYNFSTWLLWLTRVAMVYLNNYLLSLDIAYIYMVISKYFYKHFSTVPVYRFRQDIAAAISNNKNNIF